MNSLEAEVEDGLMPKHEPSSLSVGVNWQELSAESHYRVATEIRRALREQNYDDAEAGIEELIDALGRSEKRALKSQLVRLMAHIIKWKSEPEKRSYSWVATIYNARDEIADIQTETPSLTDELIEALWDKSFQAAKREAEGEMNQKSSVASLTWKDVFDKDYEVR
jgi:Domain of unknown function DUF29